MIHLDHASTSPLLPEVLDAMLPWLGVAANPSSAHRSGQAAAAALERARVPVAALAGADPAGVVFTSGATEANHLHLRGAARSRPGGAVVLSSVEHPSVEGAADALLAEGTPLLRLPVDRRGVTTLPDALPRDVAVVALIAAQHETGVIQPIDAARALARSVGARLHVDATHAAGRIALPRDVDALVLGAHKLGGPAGIGALVLPDGGPFPALFPGTQERGRRGGTPFVAGAVGFGVAAELALARLAARAARHATLGARLEAGLVALGARIVGVEAPRVPGTTLAVFPGLRGDGLVAALDLRGFAVSAGAACASGSLVPSPTLRAMGDPEPAGALRVTLGPETDEAAILALLAALAEVVPAAREAAALDAG